MAHPSKPNLNFSLIICANLKLLRTIYITVIYKCIFGEIYINETSNDSLILQVFTGNVSAYILQLN